MNSLFLYKKKYIFSYWEKEKLKFLVIVAIASAVNSHCFLSLQITKSLLMIDTVSLTYSFDARKKCFTKEIKMHFLYSMDALFFAGHFST